MVGVIWKFQGAGRGSVGSGTVSGPVQLGDNKSEYENNKVVVNVPTRHDGPHLILSHFNKFPFIPSQVYVGLVTSQATRARLEKSSARAQLVS